jgi:hypothetical protein
MVDSMREGMSKLAREPLHSEALQHTAQVLQFRPRVLDRLAAHESSETLGAEFDDFAQYERDQAEDENLNHPRRMLMNGIAVAVVTVLIGVGVWLADTIADMERDQDCVLQGRQNCAPVELAVPPASR